MQLITSIQHHEMCLNVCEHFILMIIQVTGLSADMALVKLIHRLVTHLRL